MTVSILCLFMDYVSESGLYISVMDYVSESGPYASIMNYGCLCTILSCTHYVHRS
jgi:hypothetical protein